MRLHKTTLINFLVTILIKKEKKNSKQSNNQLLSIE